MGDRRLADQAIGIPKPELAADWTRLMAGTERAATQRAMASLQWILAGATAPETLKLLMFPAEATQVIDRAARNR